MENQSIFHLLSEITQKERISCILIGGFAVNYYKVSRQTADVDFLTTKEDFQKMSVYLSEAGYSPCFKQENFVQLKSNRSPLWDVDFMFVDKDTFMKIFKEGKSIKIAGQKLTVPSLEHLIALKLHSIKFNPKIRMTKDLPDVIHLIRMNKVNIKDKQFMAMCLKYGTEELYSKIQEALS